MTEALNTWNLCRSSYFSTLASQLAASLPERPSTFSFDDTFRFPVPPSSSSRGHRSSHVRKSSASSPPNSSPPSSRASPSPIAPPSDHVLPSPVTVTQRTPAELDAKRKRKEERMLKRQERERRKKDKAEKGAIAEKQEKLDEPDSFDPFPITPSTGRPSPSPSPSSVSSSLKTEKVTAIDEFAGFTQAYGNDDDDDDFASFVNSPLPSSVSLSIQPASSAAPSDLNGFPRDSFASSVPPLYASFLPLPFVTDTRPSILSKALSSLLLPRRRRLLLLHSPSLCLILLLRLVPRPHLFLVTSLVWVSLLTIPPQSKNLHPRLSQIVFSRPLTSHLPPRIPRQKKGRVRV